MNISLSPQTHQLLQERMKKGGFSSPDDVVLIALETMDQVEGEPFESLDEATRAAIERAEAQSDRGEGRSWEEVREELRAKYANR